MNAVELEHVSKTFGSTVAVDDLSLAVPTGSIYGFIGPNGSGKTTTLRVIMNIFHPDRGTVRVFGAELHGARSGRIGYLPEESYLYRYLDSGETLDFFGSLFKLTGAERRQRAEQLLEMVGLNQVRYRTVGEFSKGMQRRIGLAQALINDPDLIILDEPTAGLDPIGCREVKDLIIALARRGKTVILSSHLLADVEDVCDRALILYGGRCKGGVPYTVLDMTGTAPRLLPAGPITLAQVRSVLAA